MWQCLEILQTLQCICTLTTRALYIQYCIQCMHGTLRPVSRRENALRRMHSHRERLALHVAASFHVYTAHCHVYTAHCAHATESMVNSRAKCLAINQVLRTKSYNSCLIFVSYKNFYYYVVPFSFLLFLTYTSIWAHKYLCFRVKFSARTRTKLSSLLHISKTAD